MRASQSGATPPDVAIIGGSAAGLFTASLLARRGIAVRVFESADRPNAVPRCLIVTNRYRDLLGPLAETACVNEIRRFELFADGRVATVTLELPDVVIERSKLIRALEQEAESQGAQIFRGHRFLGLDAHRNGLSFKVECDGQSHRREMVATTIVGADGAFSTVARAAGWQPQPTVPLIQAVVRLPQDVAPDTTRIWFRPDDTPYFYWLIPETAGRGVLGLIGEDERDTRRVLERFLAAQQLEPLEIQAARVPLYARWTPVHRRIGNGHAYVVGDAAGQVKVSTVGGVVTGLQGAMGVAEAILTGRPGRELRTLRRELDLHMLLRKAIHRFNTGDYSKLLSLLNPDVQQLLGVVHRDQPIKLLRKLVLRRPHLLLLGLRGLLTSALDAGTTKGSVSPRRFRRS